MDYKDLAIKWFNKAQKWLGQAKSENKPQSSVIIPIMHKQVHLPRRGTRMTRINRNLSLRGIGHALHALLLNITRIFTDPCASASSVQSVFYCTPSAFICVHLRLIYVSLSDIIQEIQIKLFPTIYKKIIESAYDYQTHSCLNLLENKPLINADKRRYVDGVEVNFLSLSKLVHKFEGWYIC